MCTSGMPKVARVGGHTHVAACRHLEAGAQAEPIDATDHRHWTFADRITRLVQPRNEQPCAVGAEGPAR